MSFLLQGDGQLVAVLVCHAQSELKDPDLVRLAQLGLVVKQSIPEHGRHAT